MTRPLVYTPEEATPIRLRLSRVKGFDLQAHSRAVNGLPAVNCARPTRFGNPFTIKGCREAGYLGSDLEIAARCIEAFRTWIDTRHWRENWAGAESEHARAAMHAGLPTLRGKNLACWCALDAACHCDVLMDIAKKGHPMTDPAPIGPPMRMEGR
jgi:hypothetical protein